MNDSNLFLNTYKRIPIEISRGEGVHLISKNGDRYLDFFSGIAVNALGHSHPKVIEAVKEQIEKFSHLSNYFIADSQTKFAQLISKYSGMKKVFLCNSGTEAIEAAIKLIRKVKLGKNMYSLSGSFHGRTFGAMSLALKEDYIKNYSPLLSNFFQIKFNDVEELENKVDENTSAVFVEFVQGDGGINLLSNDFLNKLIQLKNKYDFFIAADEIQSGIGRTGKGFAFNHFNFVPDVVVTAKAIGGGLPLGTLLVSDELAEGFHPGDHGSTFGGNPVSCAAGIVVLKEVFENNLLENVESLGSYFLSELNTLKNKFPDIINEVRGIGFMIGIELSQDAEDLITKMRNKKVLLNLTSKNVIRILPPLIACKGDIDFCLFNLHEALKEL